MLTASTIIPVNCSTLYLTDLRTDSATALIDTPYFTTTQTSIEILSPEVCIFIPLTPLPFLMEEEIAFEEAVEIVTKVCAYTNHTILAEALEKWPKHFLETVVPQLVPIIEKLNEMVNEKYHDPAVAIIDQWNNVHMANMDIHFTHSTNGVAALHTEILKNSELNHFYKIYPERSDT